MFADSARNNELFNSIRQFDNPERSLSFLFANYQVRFDFYHSLTPDNRREYRRLMSASAVNVEHNRDENSLAPSPSDQ